MYIDLVDSLYSSETFQPFEGLVHHEYREYGRGIEHRPSINMRAVVQHRRYITAYLAEGILPHNRESDPRRAYILLRSAIDEGIFADIHRTGHDIGRHIGYERDRTVDVITDLCTVNGIVGRDMEIVYILRDNISLRDIAECLVGR